MSTLNTSEGADDKAALFAQRINEYAEAVNQKRDQDAEAILWDTFAMVAAEAMENPSPDLIWRTLAADCEQSGNWAGAEEAHQKAIALIREEPNPACPVKPLLDLAALYEILGRKEEARILSDDALALARKSEISSLVLLALEARCNSELGEADLEEIRMMAAEGFAAQPAEPIFFLTKARFLLLQAYCLVAMVALRPSDDVERALRNTGSTNDCDEYKSAEACLAAAKDLASAGKRNEFLAGWQWYHSRASEISAMIHAARGETAQAIAASSEVVAHQRAINAQLHVAGIRSRYRLAEKLRALAGYLEAGGKEIEAAAARAEAEQLMREFSAT